MCTRWGQCGEHTIGRERTQYHRDRDSLTRQVIPSAVAWA